ncbi:hypothetical protein KL86PLE_40097 [uncultured Pleomorphomonas sp.]|uniref:Uncharacterized protein n=1 Tax=uncultured Pleomorphomonas sp. TaxID=442121 RepID=A0A212LFF3_9HYPH|nr:hypothetical protein KL86PLE_40097 [uncultured Pleomorphomonas sp.]
MRTHKKPCDKTNMTPSKTIGGGSVIDPEVTELASALTVVDVLQDTPSLTADSDGGGMSINIRGLAKSPSSERDGERWPPGTTSPPARQFLRFGVIDLLVCYRPTEDLTFNLNVRKLFDEGYSSTRMLPPTPPSCLLCPPSRRLMSPRAKDNPCTSP